MGMEELILLGGFAAMAILGWYIMASLDKFLDKARQKNKEQAQIACFHIATSCFDAIPAVSNTLKDIEHLAPNVRCTLSLGHEQEVIRSFDRGDADVTIISADSHLESETLAQWKCITLPPQPFTTENGMVEVKPIAKQPQQQKVLWKRNDNQIFVLNFIRHLCGQQP